MQLARSLLPIVLLTVVGCGDPANDEPTSFDLSVMTYNVLCSFCPGLGADQHDPWADRAPLLRDLFAEYDLDLIGAQELTYTAPGAHNSDEVRDLAGETYEAIYYENPQLMDYPDATLLYRASRFTEHDRGFFWLSSTPDVPLSADFDPDGQFARVVAWAELEDLESGEHFIFVTTHFDNNSPSQTLSAPLFLSRLQPLANRLPLVITGDFNSNLSTEAYGILTGSDDPKLENASDLVPEGPRAVGPEADRSNYYWDGRIDHIFL
ncbi:MAG: hypothetical protein CMH55_03770, partial [Myxococcales bacterium]|nr:hypothetical protein [Myxococcales bacterium]